MKQTAGFALAVLVVVMCAAAAPGQAPVISAFSGNGVLLCTNLVPGSKATVEWAPSLTGPWTNSWAGLQSIEADSNGTIQVAVPMYYRVCSTINSAPDGMVLVPAGPFAMGNCMSPDEGWADELPSHTVYVSAFYMDATEVTGAQWQEVYEWAIGHGYTFINSGSAKETNHPIQTINWYDALKWCNARSEKEGLTPSYYSDESQTAVYRSGQLDLGNGSVKWTGGYRLPTEAEWEKAARGGAAGHRFPWSDTDTISHARANYWAGEYRSYDLSYPDEYPAAYEAGLFPYTSPVAAFAPNGYGLYDMAGNVLEWCWDWYDSGYYSASPGTDPRGPAEALNFRVTRGASWDHLVWDARCSFRYDGTVPGFASFYVGFRCVRGLLGQ